MALICLDLDNTLIHSDRCHTLAYNYALSKLNRRKVSPAFIFSLFGGPKSFVAEKLMPNATKKELAILLDLHDTYLIRNTARNARAIKGAKAAIHEIKKEHELAVLSNSRHKTIIALLNSSGLKKSLFDVLIGYDDVKHSKPQPDEIFKAEKLLHHKASLMVGDSIYDILAGKRARVKTIGVLTGNYSRTALLKYRPFKIIPSISHLPAMIKKHNMV